LLTLTETVAAVHAAPSMRADIDLPVCFGFGLVTPLLSPPHAKVQMSDAIVNAADVVRIEARLARQGCEPASASERSPVYVTLRKTDLKSVT
jgi:hypothetical protein